MTGRRNRFKGLAARGAVADKKLFDANSGHMVCYATFVVYEWPEVLLARLACLCSSSTSHLVRLS